LSGRGMVRLAFGVVVAALRNASFSAGRNNEVSLEMYEAVDLCTL